jgi:hypothetical protein
MSGIIERDRAGAAVENRSGEPYRKMGTEARVASNPKEGADDADNDVTDQPKPGPALDAGSSTPQIRRQQTRAYQNKIPIWKDSAI